MLIKNITNKKSKRNSFRWFKYEKHEAIQMQGIIFQNQKCL